MTSVLLRINNDVTQQLLFFVVDLAVAGTHVAVLLEYFKVFSLLEFPFFFVQQKSDD
jgi:hypothetical protein